MRGVRDNGSRKSWYMTVEMIHTNKKSMHETLLSLDHTEHDCRPHADSPASHVLLDSNSSGLELMPHDVAFRLESYT